MLLNEVTCCKVSFACAVTGVLLKTDIDRTRRWTAINLRPSERVERSRKWVGKYCTERARMTVVVIQWHRHKLWPDSTHHHMPRVFVTSQQIIHVTTTITINLRPLYVSTCVNQHPQLRTGGFSAAKFYYLHAFSDGTSESGIGVGWGLTALSTQSRSYCVCRAIINCVKLLDGWRSPSGRDNLEGLAGQLKSTGSLCTGVCSKRDYLINVNIEQSISK